MTICVADDANFRLGGKEFSVVRVQGDADHEWLLLPEACGPPLSAEVIDFASYIWSFASLALQSAELCAAINALLICSEPTLSERDQLVSNHRTGSPLTSGAKNPVEEHLRAPLGEPASSQRKQ
jgi:hypothetical protein